MFVGVVSSSYFICANIGAAHFGVVPAILDPNGVDLPVVTQVALWKWYFDRAKFHLVTAVAVSTFSFSTAAYLTTSSSFRELLLCGAAMAFSIVPFTAVFMLPVNNELIEIFNLGLPEGDSKDSSPRTEERAIQAIDKWRNLHRVRLALGAGAWIVGLSALVVCM